MTEISLPRRRTLTVTQWLNDYEFIGVISYTLRYMQGDDVVERQEQDAAYGWARTDKPGTAWNIYTITLGHIQKAGTVKRNLIQQED